MADSDHFPDLLRAFIGKQDWTFARTMPQWPHEYIVRDRVTDCALFESLIRHIRDHGTPGRFYHRILVYFEDDGLLYWTMGEPIEESVVVNRCRVEDSYESRLKNGTLPQHSPM